MLKCGRCGRVHFERSRAEVDQEIAEFTAFLRTISFEARTEYYPRTAERYKFCCQCKAPHTEMVIALDADVPQGSTLLPILGPQWN